MREFRKQDFRIALIGVEFEENLSLRYLAGALKAAGYHHVDVIPYNGISQVEETVSAIMEGGYDLVGVSMAFQVRAVEDMTLIQLLRIYDFQGHITAGGQFVTLHYEEIFQDCTGLDSVLRFEAEATIVELADALCTRAELKDVHGLVWKDPEAGIQANHVAPSPQDIDELALPMRKNGYSEFMGLKSVHMIGSRGCHATCRYCCISALVTERRSASKDSGGTAAVAGTRRRSAVHVAEEIAHLYFAHGIRIFEFQDDNWIHPKIPAAIEYFTMLKQELDKKGVGQIGLTLKTRADSVQPEIIKVLKNIGLIRVFVGIESGTQNLLSKLGRRSRANTSLQALQVLREHRIPAYFNALLFGPDILFEDIEPELAFLEQCSDFPFEIVEVVIYGKTGLYESLKAQGRLHGHYLDYDYDYIDKNTQDAHAMIRQLQTRHFGVYSPVKMAADLGFNLGLMQVFYTGEATDTFAGRVAELTQRINADQIRIIRKAVGYAEEGRDIEAAIHALQAETAAIDLQFYREIIELNQEMERCVTRLSHNTKVHSYYRKGAVVHSALLAGLFMLLAPEANAQLNAVVDTAITRKAVDMIIRSDSGKTWDEVRTKLMTVNGSLTPYPDAIRSKVDLILKATNPKDSMRKRIMENMQKFSNDVWKLSDERMKDDYSRLIAILMQHRPKIKIASSLEYFVDTNGHVFDVGFIDAKAHHKLKPQVKAVILDLLKEKNYYAREARRHFLADEDKVKKFNKKLAKHRSRMGPMD